MSPCVSLLRCPPTSLESRQSKSSGLGPSLGGLHQKWLQKSACIRRSLPSPPPYLYRMVCGLVRRHLLWLWGWVGRPGRRLQPSCPYKRRSVGGAEEGYTETSGGRTFYLRGRPFYLLCPPPGFGGGRLPYHVRPPMALTSAPPIWGRTFSVKRPFFVRPRIWGADVLPVGGGRNTSLKP